VIESQRPGHYREAHLLLGIALLALLVRLVFSFVLFPHLAGPLGLGSDPDQYGQLAQNWVDGKGYIFYDGAEPSTYRGPGYPLLLAAVYVVCGDLLPGAVLVQALIGALVCLPIYYIGKQAFGCWVGRTAALMGALHPLLIWYTPRLRCEPLLALLLALAISWSLRARNSGSLKDAFITGLFFGCAALVHQVAILLPLVLFTAFLLLEAVRSDLAKQFAVVTVAMVGVIAPWTVRNYLVSGLVIPVHSGGITQFVAGSYEFEHYHEAPLQSVELAHLSSVYAARLLGFNDVSEYDGRATGVDQALLPYALSYLRSGPEKLLIKTIVQLPRFWYLSESPLKSRVLAAIQGAFLLPALVGGFHTLRGSRRGLPLLVTIVYFNVLYAALVVEGRYSTPVVPYVVVLAAAGLRMIFDIIRKRRSRRRA